MYSANDYVNVVQATVPGGQYVQYHGQPAFSVLHSDRTRKGMKVDRRPQTPAEEQLDYDLAVELHRLHSNNADAVPYQYWKTDPKTGAKRKNYAPMRERCPNCPPFGSGGSPYDTCSDMAQHFALLKEQEKGTPEPQALMNARAVAKANKKKHDVKDNLRLWVEHVRGYGRDGRDFFRGVYSHTVTNGLATGRDVIWDFDAAYPGRTPQELSVDVERTLERLGVPFDAYYTNTSFSGKGAHTRLCLDGLVDSRVRERLGKAVLIAAGYKPGGDPSKGEIEAFPKQSGNGTAEYGNLIALPLGGEKAPIVHRVSRTPVEKSQALAVLRGVRQLDRATLKAVCLALEQVKPGLGFDIDNMPTEAAPKQYAKKLPRKFSVGGRTMEVTYRDALVEAIEARHDLVWLVENHFGRVCGGSGKYAGPCHEPAGGALSFSLFVGKDGSYVWKCHGDCEGSKPGGGGQIQLYQAWLMNGHGGPKRKNATWAEARDELARVYGIDPDAFRAAQAEKERARVEAIQTTREVPRLIQNWIDEAAQSVTSRAPDQKVVHATWRKLARAFTAVVIQAHHGRDSSLPNSVDSTKVALALLHAMPNLMTLTEHMSEIEATGERLKAGAPTMGHAWIETTFGAWSLSKLLHALSYQIGRPMVELNALMPGRRYQDGSKARDALKAVVASIPTDSVIPVDVSARATFRRTIYCVRYKADGWGDGHKVATRSILCASYMTCRACNWVRAQTDYELATSESKDHHAISWLHRPQVHSICMTVASTAEADLLIAHVTKRVKGPKFRSLGTTETGEITVRYSTDDEGIGVDLRAACDTWSVERGRSDVAVYETTLNSVKGPERVTNDYMSLFRNTDRLIRLGAPGVQELNHWVYWTKHHRLIARSKKALPWPTREQAREAAREKKGDQGGPEYEGQKIVWKLVHVRTGFVIAEQEDYPFTIDQAIRLAAMNTLFHSALANNPVQTATG